jgi:hypothetical protein
MSDGREGGPPAAGEKGCDGGCCDASDERLDMDDTRRDGCRGRPAVFCSSSASSAAAGDDDAAAAADAGGGCGAGGEGGCGGGNRTAECEEEEAAGGEMTRG